MNKNNWYLFAILFFAASLGLIEGAITNVTQALIDAPDEKRKKAESISEEGIYELVHQSSQLPQPLCMLIKKYAEICCPHEFFKLPFSQAVRARMYDLFPPKSLQHQQFALSFEASEPLMMSQSHSYSGMYQVTCSIHCLEIRDRMCCPFMRIIPRNRHYLCGPATAVNDTHVAALVYSEDKKNLSIYIWRIGKQNPEHRLTIPLQKKPLSQDLLCDLCLSVADSHGSYYLAAHFPAQNNIQQHIVYRWELRGTEVRDFTPVTFQQDNLTGPSNWTAILDSGDWYLKCYPHENCLIQLKAEQAHIQRIEPNGNNVSPFPFTDLGLWNYHLLTLARSDDRLNTKSMAEAVRSRTQRFEQNILNHCTIQSPEYEELKKLTSYFTTRLLNNDWCILHNQKASRIFFAHVPRWMLIHADALMRLCERVAHLEKQGIKTEETKKTQISWEQLPQPDQEFLNSAPPVVRQLVVEKLGLKDVPEYPCIMGTLDDSEETRETVQRRYLQDREEAQQAQEFWETCAKRCCASNATIEPTNAPITTPSPTPHTPPAPLHNAIQSRLLFKQILGQPCAPRRSQSIPTQVPSPQRRSWRSIVGYTLVGATSAYCVYRGIRSKMAHRTKAFA